MGHPPSIEEFPPYTETQRMQAKKFSPLRDRDGAGAKYFSPLSNNARPPPLGGACRKGGLIPRHWRDAAIVAGWWFMSEYSPFYTEWQPPRLAGIPSR
jgi:hypothetical protein